MSKNSDKQDINASILADLCVKSLENGKGENIIRLKVDELSVLADYFILCTANSNPHIRALSERLKREVSKTLKIKPRQDGKSDSNWIVMDYGNTVVHILSPEMRELYNLESLWGDNPEIEPLEKIYKSFSRND